MSAEPNGGSSDQASAGSQQQGQTPQANKNGSGTPPAATTGQQPQAGSGNTAADAQSSSGAANSGGTTFTLEEAQRMISELRRENASHRTKLKQFEDVQAAAELAKLSETEKLQRQYDQAQQQLAELQIEQQQYRLAREIARHAPSLNLIDPDAAALMLTASGEIEYDAEGKPTNVAKLLEKLVAEKPYLVASNVRSPIGLPSSGGATNPPRGGLAAGQQNQPRPDPKDVYKNRKGLADPTLWKRS